MVLFSLCIDGTKHIASQGNVRWLDEWKLYEACSSAYLLAQGLAESSLFATHSIEKVDLIEIQTAIAASSNYDDGKTVQFILVLHNFVMLNRFNGITSHWGIFPISKGSRIFTTRSLEYFMCVLCKLFPFFVLFHSSFFFLSPSRSTNELNIRRARIILEHSVTRDFQSLPLFVIYASRKRRVKKRSIERAPFTLFCTF